jgi:hypothetical protein
MPRPVLTADNDPDGQRRAIYRDKRNEVAGATVFRLQTLDRRYRRQASDDPLEQARRAAVRDELQQRGYHVENDVPPAGKS